MKFDLIFDELRIMQLLGVFFPIVNSCAVDKSAIFSPHFEKQYHETHLSWHVGNSASNS